MSEEGDAVYACIQDEGGRGAITKPYLYFCRKCIGIFFL